MQDEFRKEKNQINSNLNETQAAEYLSLQNRQTLANWRHMRKGPAYCRVGRRIIYRLEDLEAYLNTHRIDPESVNVYSAE